MEILYYIIKPFEGLSLKIEQPKPFRDLCQAFLKGELNRFQSFCHEKLCFLKIQELSKETLFFSNITLLIFATSALHISFPNLQTSTKLIMFRLIQIVDYTNSFSLSNLFKNYFSQQNLFGIWSIISFNNQVIIQYSSNLVLSAFLQEGRAVYYTSPQSYILSVCYSFA